MKKIVSILLAVFWLTAGNMSSLACTGAEGSAASGQYDYVEAFTDRGFAVVHAGGKEGVIDTEGREIIAPEWDGVVIDNDGRKALCINYPEGPVVVVDLDAGETYYREESLPTAYVADRYALQDNVRVYTQNNLVGLEDADGNILCEAKYDYIDVFMERDCAIVHIGDKVGIVTRDGRETVPVEWDHIQMTSDGKTVRCSNYSPEVYSNCIFDAETGEELYRTDEDTQSDMEYDRILIRNVRLPYRTDVYDARMKLLFSVNAYLENYEHYYLAEFNDGSRGMYDLEGNLVIDGLTDIGYESNGYAAYFRTEYTYESETEQIIDGIGNGLDRLLWKNNGRYRDRNCLEWVLYRFGMETRPRQEVKKYLGIISVNGERFEYDGAYQKSAWGDFPSDVIKIGGEGLYIVNVAADGESDESGWTYFDSEGNQAVPGNYSFAYPFVDGSAVVRKDGVDYLIDRNGEMISMVCEGVCWNTGNVIAYEQPIIAACYDNCAYHRVIDRKGNFINDTMYKTFRYDFEGHFFAEILGGGATVTDIYGNGLLKDSWDGVSTEDNDHTDGAWVWKDDLLYHVDLRTGEQTSEQGYRELGHGAARLPGGDNWVVVDETGNPVGPYYQSGWF